jgi:hypothetical protein
LVAEAISLRTGKAGDRSNNRQEAGKVQVVGNLSSNLVVVSSMGFARACHLVAEAIKKRKNLNHAAALVAGNVPVGLTPPEAVSVPEDCQALVAPVRVVCPVSREVPVVVYLGQVV